MVGPGPATGAGAEGTAGGLGTAGAVGVDAEFGGIGPLSGLGFKLAGIGCVTAVDHSGPFSLFSTGFKFTGIGCVTAVDHPGLPPGSTASKGRVNSEALELLICGGADTPDGRGGRLIRIVSFFGVGVGGAPPPTERTGRFAGKETMGLLGEPGASAILSFYVFNSKLVNRIIGTLGPIFSYFKTKPT